VSNAKSEPVSSFTLKKEKNPTMIRAKRSAEITVRFK